MKGDNVSSTINVKITAAEPYASRSGAVGVSFNGVAIEVIRDKVATPLADPEPIAFTQYIVGKTGQVLDKGMDMLRTAFKWPGDSIEWFASNAPGVVVELVTERDENNKLDVKYINPRGYALGGGGGNPSQLFAEAMKRRGSGGATGQPMPATELPF